LLIFSLIIFPLASIPGVLTLRKREHIKLFHFIFSLMNTFFSIVLYYKYKAFLKTHSILEKFIFFEELDLGYSVQLTSKSLTLTVLINIYFFVTSLLVQKKSKLSLSFVSLVHFCILFWVLSQNLILISITLFAVYFSVSLLGSRNDAHNRFSTPLFLIGVLSFLGTFLIYGLLYESVFSVLSFDLNNLIKMQTPFVKNSFYSTQFALFIFFTLGCFSIASAYAIKFFPSNQKQPLYISALSYASFLYVLYLVNLSIPALFPEVLSAYLPPQRTLVLASGVFVFILFFLKCAQTLYIILMSRREELHK